MDISLIELKEIIKGEVGLLLYFSSENCNVCHALKPKLKELFDSSFSELKQIYLDSIFFNRKS